MFTLLQRAGVGIGGGPPAGGPGDTVPILFMLAFYAVAIFVGLVVQIFFLWTLSNCFKEISEKNRQMSPGQVWLNLIPIFGIVWIILTIIKLSDSLKDEYESRGLTHDGDYGKTVGLVYVISGLLGCGCIALPAWIMYWIKVAGFTKEMRESGGLRKKSKRRNDDDDDRRDDD